MWNSDQLTWFSWTTFLNRGYTSCTLIDLSWSRSFTSHALFTLVLSQLPVANTFSRLSTNRDFFPCSHFLIIPPSRHGKLWWADSTVTHSLLLKVNNVKSTVITHSKARTRKTSFHPRCRLMHLSIIKVSFIDGWPEIGWNKPTQMHFI